MQDYEILEMVLGKWIIFTKNKLSKDLLNDGQIT